MRVFMDHWVAGSPSGDKGRKGDIKAMIIRGTNPAHTLPNPRNVHKAMSNPDSCIVGIEAFPVAVTPQYAALARAPAFIFSPAPFSSFALQRATG